MINKSDFLTSLIIPTGIGASIGGFAGDASPSVRLLSSVSPVIVNPNAVNGAVFSGIKQNVLYTEGYSLNKFFKGEIALKPSKFNKIGVIVDAGIPKDVLNIHINTLNAIKSVYGIEITAIEITNEPVGVEFYISESGISNGTLTNPQTLIKSTENLIKQGAEAIAVVCYFPPSDIADSEYSENGGVDPVGGVEAIISHLISREFNIPVAHAPAFALEDIEITTKIVDRRASSEYITPTFLPCIILGLYNAPKITEIENKTPYDYSIDDLNCLIMPYDSLGCIPVFECVSRNIPILAVKNNYTTLDITAKNLGLDNKIIEVNSYLEATGYVMALKEGISINTILGIN
ncbi:MAG: DUF3326 domain-containing protein [bacterium]